MQVHVPRSDLPGCVVGIDWGFNGYGMRFLPCHRTSQMNRLLLEDKGIRRWPCPMNLEGGSFHWDGIGTLITTEECLLNDNRNPHMAKGDIEATLRQHLGVEKVIWLPYGLVDDATDGHVDNVACFVGEAKVIALDEADRFDDNYHRLKDNLEVLSSSTDVRGRFIEVIRIPQAKRRMHPIQGTRLPLSHINLYIANGGVVMPTYGDEDADGYAKEVMRDIFPDRELLTLDGIPIALGGGCVHCITQQQPRPEPD